MIISDTKFKEICRKCLPLKALDQSHINVFLLLRCKYNFVALESTGLGEDLKVSTVPQILSESSVTIQQSQVTEAKSHDCSHT